MFAELPSAATSPLNLGKDVYSISYTSYQDRQIIYVCNYVI